MYNKNRNYFKDYLYRLTTFDDIYNLCFNLKFSEFYIDKLHQLYKECKDEEFSLDSLKDIIWFLHNLYPPLNYKSITVSEGLFYFEFYIKQDKYTLKFKGNSNIDYVKNGEDIKSRSIELADLLTKLYIQYVSSYE